MRLPIFAVTVVTMMSAGMISSGFLLAGDNNEANELLTMCYPVADLAVWSTDLTAQPKFDPSILITLIKAKVGEDGWKNGAGINGFEKNASLVISQTKKGHEQINHVLDALRPQNPREQSERLLR